MKFIYLAVLSFFIGVRFVNAWNVVHENQTAQYDVINFIRCMDANREGLELELVKDSDNVLGIRTDNNTQHIDQLIATMTHCATNYAPLVAVFVGGPSGAFDNEQQLGSLTEFINGHDILNDVSRYRNATEADYERFGAVPTPSPIAESSVRKRFKNSDYYLAWIHSHKGT